jgi:type VI secretion system secreted protein Hcp
MATNDYFLEIDGIPGESADSKRKNSIDIESFSWGVANSGSAAHGGGGGAGKVSMQDFHFVSRVSKASPKLFLACATGQHIKKAVLTVRKAGGDQQEYYVVTLTDCLVSKFEQGTEDEGHTTTPAPTATASTSTGTIVPVDQFSMNFGRIELEYRPQRADGSLDMPVKAGFDFKKGTAL